MPYKLPELSKIKPANGPLPSWKTLLTLSEHLDPAGEDALYKKTAKQTPITDRDVLHGDKLFLFARLGRKLTSEDQARLNIDDHKRKFSYVVMIGQYRDKVRNEHC